MSRRKAASPPKYQVDQKVVLCRRISGIPPGEVVTITAVHMVPGPNGVPQYWVKTHKKELMPTLVLESYLGAVQAAFPHFEE